VPTEYVVKQGDYLAKIARDHGFTDYIRLWNAPENARLRQKRKNPNVLFPGDVVAIPDRDSKHEDGQTQTRHTFRLKNPSLKLRVALEDAFRKPVRNAACQLAVDGKFFKLQTDGSGKLEHEISPTAQRADLVIRDADTPFKDVVLKLKIGNLDPVDTFSGQVGRLMNLGYLTAPVEDANDPLFESAVEEFQCDQTMTVDGICGHQTQAKLLQVHGC